TYLRCCRKPACPTKKLNWGACGFCHCWCYYKHGSAGYCLVNGALGRFLIYCGDAIYQNPASAWRGNGSNSRYRNGKNPRAGLLICVVSSTFGYTHFIDNCNNFQ